MPRPKTAIDRDALRARIRGLQRSALLVFLDRAFDFLSDARIAKTLEGYVDVRGLRRDASAPRPTLLDAVRAFHAASLAGKHYEAFQVNWRNSTQMSDGTAGWIAECERLFVRCLAAEEKGGPAVRPEVRDSLRLLFDLLRRIDRGSEEIVFFADEGGSWQVGVDWSRVLPCHFRCLADTADPEAYAAEVLGLIRDFASHDAAPLLASAHAAATPEQRRALPTAIDPRQP